MRPGLSVHLRRAEEDQIVRVQKAQDGVDRNQRAVRVSTAEGVRRPDMLSGHDGSFEGYGTENPHGAMGEVAREKFVRPTHVDRLLE